MLRPLLPFIITPLVYIMLSNQVIREACVGDVSAAIEFLVGGVILLSSMALGVAHQKNKGVATQENAKTRVFAKYIEAFKGFAYKKPVDPQLTHPETPKEI